MSRLLTFERLKWASFTHSAVYTVLLIVWLVPGLKTLEAVFGMTHGIGWIAMSLACLVALRRRIIDLRLAVAVAVLGGVGPFIGSYEFARQSRSARRELDHGDADGARDVGVDDGVTHHPSAGRNSARPVV